MGEVVVLVLLLFPAIVVGQQQQEGRPLSSIVELAALFSLRSSLGLRSRDWPRKVDPCSAWVGITCRPDGRVVGISISGLQRTRLGRLNPRFAVDALSNFTFLATFNSSGFALPGPIPGWFGPETLPSLTVLDLRASSVSGSIPPAIGSLSNLTHLDISRNSLTGSLPPSLSALSRLSVLDLSHNLLTGSIPHSFFSLRSLSTFDLSNNTLTGPIPPATGTLPLLASLNLSNNGFSGSIPGQLGNLSGLVSLDVGANSLSGALPANLFGLNSLQRMVLRNNRFSGALPAEIWLLPNLGFFDVSYNNLTGSLPRRRNSNALNVSSGSVFNFSHNQLFGTLTLSEFVGTGFVDLSDNFFQGRTALGSKDVNVSLVYNCLENLPSQRSFSECRLFYANKGLIFDEGFGPSPDSSPQPSPAHRKSSQSLKFVLAGVFGGLGFVVLLVAAIAFLQRRSGGPTNQREVRVDPVPSGVGHLAPGSSVNFTSLGESFTYEQLLQATANFSDLNLVKHGHSGYLFRGTLEGEIQIIVKRIDVKEVKKNPFLVELDVLSMVSHTRLLPLLGHCLQQENEKFLVYKYMPNGDLSNALYRKTFQEEDSLQSLDWITRLKIAIGAAEALSHLHHECTPPLVHRDIQASSILLDDKFEVRLGSLSEVCTQEGDGHQNVISRFLRLSQNSEQGASGSSPATCAYDVYCFGKVLLELVTGKLGISGSNDTITSEWLEQTIPFINVFERELVTKIVDPSLIVDEDLLEEVWAMAIVAKSCLNPKPSKRPLTRYILKALENPLKVVRAESFGSSARLRTTSSRGSWNAALFGSWRHSSSNLALHGPPPKREEDGSLIKQSVVEWGSHGSSRGGGEILSSRKKLSKEIFPEPAAIAWEEEGRTDGEDDED